MATFRGFSAVDMRDFGFEEGGDYVSTIATPTTFADVTDGLTAYFIGSGFTYDGNERFTGGTIQRIELRDGSEVIYRLDGSWSAAAAEALYDPVTDEIDIGEYQAFFLGSHDRVTGSAQADYLIGLGGNDTLDGGGGSDTMAGGTGNDTYRVNATGDRVVESSGQGSDTVQSTIRYTLGANVENLVLLGTAAISGTGNDGANRLTGNTGANLLDGRLGNDTMIGGLGNDTYVVNAAGDVVTEAAANGGSDTVRSGISYTLGSNVEQLVLTGAARTNGSGNALNNTIDGNAAGNRLNGLDGDDLLRGNGGADTLLGGIGNDTLDGGSGADTLNGGGGADLFRFASPLGSDNVDRLEGFSRAADQIELDGDVFTGMAAGALAASAFRAGAVARDGNDRIVYDASTGALYFDADGNGAGAALQFAQLTPGTALAAADFFVG